MIQTILLLVVILTIVVFWDKPKHLLFLTILLLPAYQIRFSLLNIPFTLLETSIIILFFNWLKHTDKTHLKSLFTEHHKLFIIIGLFFIASTISVFISPNLRAAAGIWKAYFLEPIIFFIIFIDTIRTREDVKKTIISLALVALAISLATFAQVLKLIPTPELWMNQSRFTGLFPYPNAAGLFLAPLIPMFIAASHSLCKKKESIALIIISLLSVVTIFFTKTEGAVVALIASFLIWAMVRSRRSRIISLTLIAIFITLVQTNNIVREKILLEDWSGQVRIMMWSDTITMLEHHLFEGAGLAGYPTVFAQFHRHPSIEIFQYPHNIFLNFWSETGSLGLISFAGLILYFLYALISQEDTRTSIFYYAVAISMLTLLIHGLVDVPYFKNDLSVLFWIIMGLIIASPPLHQPKQTYEL